MEMAEVIERRGWSNGGGSTYAQRYAPRQCCRWTDKEDYDLIREIKFRLSNEWICQHHQRSLGSITSRLRLPERAQAGHDRYVQGIPKPSPVSYKTSKRDHAIRRAIFLRNIKEKQHDSIKERSGNHPS